MVEATTLDPSDDLSKVIRVVCQRKDAANERYSANDVLAVIRADYPEAIDRKGKALALKQTLRLIALHLRSLWGDDDIPGDETFQLDLPGIEGKLPSHENFTIPDPADPTKEVVMTGRQDLITTLERKSSLRLRQRNTLRCIAAERREQRVIDLLETEGCDTLAEYKAKRDRMTG